MPTRVDLGIAFRDISVESYWGCGVGRDGRTYCWGPRYAPAGRLGDGVVANDYVFVVARVAGQR